jgi:hypothetical protein
LRVQARSEILDLGQKPGFNPDALMAHALGIGPGPSYERFKPLLQIGGRDLVEAVVDFAGIDQIVALAPADVEPVPLRTSSVKPAMVSVSR